MRPRTWGIIALILFVLAILSIFLGQYSVISMTNTLLNSKPNSVTLLSGDSINFNSYGSSQLLVLYNTSIGKPLQIIGLGQQANITGGRYLAIIVSASNASLYNNYTSPVTVYYSIVTGNITLAALFSLLSFFFIILTLVFAVITLISWIRSRRRQ